MTQIFDTNTQEGDTGPVFYGNGNFFGLKFFNEVKDDLDFDRHVSCIPSISLLNANTNILLDYTQCISSSTSKYISDIIQGISLGAGFTLENAKHIDPNTGVVSDLSGTFTYSATFDKAIYGNVSSVSQVENLDKKYNSIGFVDEFDATFSVQNTNTTESNTIKNLFGTSISPCFYSLGVRVGDHVKILNGTNASSTLHPIVSLYEDYNDHEIIQFGNSADFVDENRSGSSTELRFYRTPTTLESTTTNNLIDASGTAIAVGDQGITSLVGRVNVITPFVEDNCFYNLNIKKPTYVCSIGSSYIFNKTHPSLLEGNYIFKISTTPDGKWGGGVPHPDVYTTDNLLVFEPLASGTFYYYCENHPNAGGIILVTTLSPLNLQQTSPILLDTRVISEQIDAFNSGIYG